jgi:cyclopropane-fatty-acyl-phospholipid synthase
VQRLEQRHDEAVQEVGEVIYRTWRIYMAGSAHGFLRGDLAIYQTLLAKPDPFGSAQVPLTRRAWFEKWPSLKMAMLNGH